MTRSLPLLRYDINRDPALFWSRYEPRNFGDWVGPLLFREMTGIPPNHTRPSHLSVRPTVLAAGSILRHLKGRNAIVWGAGIISKSDVFDRPYRTLAVRGPRTRDRFIELGYPCPDVYGDPAILLPRFIEPANESRDTLGIIPHFRHVEEARALLAPASTVNVIDVCEPVDKVVKAITSCSLIASSSLHGLIVGAAYGLPVGWIEFDPAIDGDGTKFFDFYESAGVSHPYSPLKISNGVHVDLIREHVLSSPQPDIECLVEPLLAACPFSLRADHAV